LHRFYGAFFGYTPPSFGVFGRTNTKNPGSGIGLADSFAFTFNHTSTPAELRSLLAHEMLHSWVNSLDASMDTAGGLDRSWFGEGLAVHYQRTLPYRAHMISSDDFLADLNETAGRYYTNARIATPNAEIPAGFWRDTRVRVLPYDRGSLYFETVDAQIRAASRGKRSLDGIVKAMLATRRAGKPMDEALYRQLLGAQLGAKGIAELDAMLAGGTVLPAFDAYGPEFRRVTRALRRFDLGFDPASLTARPRIVRGLIAGSQAQKAGLREGDEITNTFPQDKLQGDQSAYLVLEVKRAGQALQIRYQPRGETVQAYQWVRVKNRQDSSPDRRN
jgi:predicted metalloprotease with PDZ domain